LVKSPPELWAECSDASSLARHLGEFGEIRITRLEPETAVAWEGEDVSGTVRLEPSGWGTRVILTVQRTEVRAARLVPVPDLEPEPESEPEPEPEPAPEPLPPAAGEPVHDEAATAEHVIEFEPEWPAEVPVKLGFFARLFGRRRRLAVHEPAHVEAAPEPVTVRARPKPEPRAVPLVSRPKPKPITTAPAPESEPTEDATAALTAALDSLGQAHHRPFSRS
jgi:hypothetical protein